MDELRKRVRAAMLERNLSGRKLASLVGIHWQTVNNFLAGVSDLRIGNQALICQYLGLDWDWKTSTPEAASS